MDPLSMVGVSDVCNNGFISYIFIACRRRQFVVLVLMGMWAYLAVTSNARFNIGGNASWSGSIGWVMPFYTNMSILLRSTRFKYMFIDIRGVDQFMVVIVTDSSNRCSIVSEFIFAVVSKQSSWAWSRTDGYQSSSSESVWCGIISHSVSFFGQIVRYGNPLIMDHRIMYPLAIMICWWQYRLDSRAIWYRVSGCSGGFTNWVTW